MQSRSAFLELLEQDGYGITLGFEEVLVVSIQCQNGLNSRRDVREQILVGWLLHVANCLQRLFSRQEPLSQVFSLIL